jgi:hypothetical protein
LNATDPSGFFLSDLKKLAPPGLRKAYKKAIKEYGFGGGILLMGTFDFLGAGIANYIDSRIAANRTASQIYVGVIGIVSTVFCGPCSIGFTALASANMAYYQSGKNLNAALKAGARAGATAAIFYGINAYYGDAWSMERVFANGVGGGVSAEINGGSFEEGFKMSAAMALLNYSAIKMREKMIAQSKLDARNDGTGKSVGFKRDGFKLGGGRYNSNSNGGPCSPLGCDQGGQGALGIPFTDKRYAYGVGSWQDYLVESYAGPHDYLNSGFWYDAATGNIRSGISTFGGYFGEALNGVNVIVATPFVIASVVPNHLAFQYYAYENLE